MDRNLKVTIDVTIVLLSMTKDDTRCCQHVVPNDRTLGHLSRRRPKRAARRYVLPRRRTTSEGAGERERTI